MMQLQKVNMRFNYGDAFSASRGTGYEVLTYNCMNGDATLFSRTDLVETAWRIVQPMLDLWKTDPSTSPTTPPILGPQEFLRSRRARGPQVVHRAQPRDPAEGSSLLRGRSHPAFFAHHGPPSGGLPPGDIVIQKGHIGRELYVISRGEVEVLADDGKVVATLSDGAYFGEIALLTSSPRTATVRARTDCDCFFLDKADFARVLRDRPQFMKAVMDLAGKRYDIAVQEEALLTEHAGA